MKRLHKLHRPYHVNYLEGFYLNLVSDIIKKTAAAAIRLKRVYRPFKGRFSFPRKVRIEWIIIAFLLALVLGGARARIIPENFTAAKVPAPLKTYPEPHIEPVATLDPIPVPEPVVAPAPVYTAPVASTGGCQTYWSGDYYLDNIIRFESGGNSCATNYLGCFGLLQACPGAPLRDACGGNPACQIAWFQANKTGGRSWAQVWQHELDFGWW